MVKDQEIINNSSHVKNQKSGPKDESNAENLLNETSDSITAISPSSSFSCSMGVASKLTKAAGSLLMPQQAFPQDYYNDGITAPANSHPVINRTRNCTENESIASLADIESSKTVQKKRGRGRPPKLKPNKQEKEVNQLKEEDSSRSSLNSISSYEKEPLCEDFENCTVKEYHSNVRDNCQPGDDSWQSANLPASNICFSSSDVAQAVKENPRSNYKIDSSLDPSGNVSKFISQKESLSTYTDERNTSFDIPISSDDIDNKLLAKNRSSDRQRGRPRLQQLSNPTQTSANNTSGTLIRNGRLTRKDTSITIKNNDLKNGHHEEHLVQFTNKLSNGLSIEKMDAISEHGTSTLNTEGDISSQDSRDVSDSSREGSIRSESEVNITIPMKVKSRWHNSSQNHAKEDSNWEMGNDNETTTIASCSLHDNNLDALNQHSDPTQQLMQKKDNRTRGDRRTTSKRISPTQKDLSGQSKAKSQLTNMDCSNTNSSEAVKRYIISETVTPAQQLEVEQRLKSFEHINTNAFICQRRRNKQTRDMECDCSFSKEDIAAGIKGCGDDCLNRLLMVECNKSCSLGDHCGNKRFQNVENSLTEVFKTEYKGVGLRAAEKISRDNFIMEYVGDVLDPQRFTKRAKKYSKNDVKHFYFMALSTEYIIDATAKGNISRFINHSCDPNAETQKWTVDGELRVGFFSKRKIMPGEEITFDYKYERYGQEAQKCYCGSSNCRGWLGGEPENENKENSEEEILEQEGFSSSSEEPEELDNEVDHQKSLECDTLSSTEDPGFSPKFSPVKVKKLNKRRLRRTPRKIKNFETDEFEEEIERLKMTGIRTKGHTVDLCRLMVKVTDSKTRLILCHLLVDADSPCKRLFLDYHGLKILNSWMSDLTWKSVIDMDVKLALEDVLSILNIPHKTMIVDSNVWQTIVNWSSANVAIDVQECSLIYIKKEIKSSNSNTSSVSASPVPSNTEIKPDHSSEHKLDCAGAQLNDEERNMPFKVSHNLSIPDENSESKIRTDDISIKDSEELSKDIGMVNILSHKREDNSFGKHDKLGISNYAEPFTDQSLDKSPETLLADESILKHGEAIKGPSISTIDEEINAKIAMVREKALSLLGVWKTLKEVFRIPRKEMVKLRAEHERELEDAEQHSKKNQINNVEDPKLTGFGSFSQQRFSFGNSTNNKFSYERNRPLVRPHSPPPKNRETRCSRFDDKTGRLNCAGISRDHRRYYISQKFEMEKEEMKKRDLLQACHENKCYYLRLDPAITPMFPEIPEFYFDPTVGTWYQMPELPPQVDVWGKLGFPHMARLPKEAYRETDSPLPDPTLIYPPGVVKVSYLYGQPMSLDPSFNHAQVDIPEPEQAIFSEELTFRKKISNPTGDLHAIPLSYIDPDTGQEVAIPEEKHYNTSCIPVVQQIALQPIPASSIETESEHHNDLISPSYYRESDQCSANVHDNSVDLDKPSPTSMPCYQKDIPDSFSPNFPKEQVSKTTKIPATADEGNNQSKFSYTKRKSGIVAMKLPASWRTTRDKEGRAYYYNSRTGQVLWVPPPGTECLEDTDSCNQNPARNINSSSHQVDMLGGTPESEDEDMDDDNPEGSLIDEDGDESDIDEEDEGDLTPDMELDAKSLDNPQGPYSDLSAQERNLLLRFSKLSKEERQHERRQKRERDREKKEYERKRRRERHGKHRKDGLVTEHLIPKRGEREKTDLMTFQEMRERLANRDAIREKQEIEEREEAEREREEERAKLRQIEKEKRDLKAAQKQAAADKQAALNQALVSKEIVSPNQIDNSPDEKITVEQGVHKVEESIVSSCEQSSKTTTAAADTSSEVSKKFKETFMKEVSKIIVKVLDPFRKADATRSKIQTIEDFKHLAKKLTEYILLKELKHCPRIEDLRFTSSVKNKTAEFVRKYMLKFGDTYERSPQKY